MSGLGIARATDFVREVFSGFQFGQGTEMKGRFKMKKLMFAAAAIAAGVAMADVQSANVVGYAQNEMNGEGNITLLTSQFIGVGTDKTFSIKDIKCADEAVDMIALNTLSPDGQLLKTYVWTDGDNGPCWFDLDEGEEANVTFDAGQSFWMQCDLEDGEMTFKTSGEVSTDDVTTELNGEGNITLVGNGSPVAVNISDVLCPDDAVDMIALNTLSPDGQLLKTYVWTDGDNGPCWFDLDEGEEAKADLPAGQAFWIQCDLEDVTGTITFPGVEL